MTNTNNVIAVSDGSNDNRHASGSGMVFNIRRPRIKKLVSDDRTIGYDIPVRRHTCNGHNAGDRYLRLKFKASNPDHPMIDLVSIGFEADKSEITIKLDELLELIDLADELTTIGEFVKISAVLLGKSYGELNKKLAVTISKERTIFTKKTLLVFSYKEAKKGIRLEHKIFIDPVEIYGE